MNQLLAERIKNLRISNKLTLEFVAEKLNISHQQYIEIENGEIAITLELLSPITSIFNIEVKDITEVLDELPTVAHQTENTTTSSFIFEMLNLFYANKNLYEKITRFKKINAKINKTIKNKKSV